MDLQEYTRTSLQRGFEDAKNGVLNQQNYMTDRGGYRTGYSMVGWHLTPEEVQYAGTPYGLTLLDGRMPEKMFRYLEAQVQQTLANNNVEFPTRT